MSFEFLSPKFLEYKNSHSTKLYETVWLTETDLGYGLGLLIEVSNEIDLENMIDFCVENLRKNLFVSGKHKSLDLFQTAINNLNDDLNDLFESTSLNLENLHLAVVFFDNRKMYLSKFNKAAVYVWRQKSIIPVSEMIDDSKRKPDENAFSEIVSGSYNFGDQIILSSRRLTSFHDLSRWYDVFLQELLLDQNFVKEFLKGEDLALHQVKMGKSVYVNTPLVDKVPYLEKIKKINYKDPKLVWLGFLILLLLSSFFAYRSIDFVQGEKTVGYYQDVLDEVDVILNNAKVEPDKNRVLYILSAAETKLNTVIDAKILLKQSKELKSEILDIKSKIDNVIKTELSLVMNLGEVDSSSEILGILKFGDEFLVFTETKVFKGLPGLYPELVYDFKEKTDAYIFNEGNNSVILRRDKQFYSFNLKSPSKPILLVSPDFEFDLNTALIYGSRFYAFDPTTNNILKANLFTNGISSFSPYLAQVPEDIQKISSFSIDGAIYIAYENGAMAKLYKGEFDDSFRVKSEPLEPITSVEKIYTSLDHSFLYVLEPEKNRVVQFYKDPQGNLNYDRQYIFDISGKVSDMFVDYNKKTLYVSSKDQVFQTPMKFID